MHATDPVPDQLLDRVPAWSQRPGRETVDPSDPVPHWTLQRGTAVPDGEAREIGLIDRDHRNAEAPCQVGGLGAENGRGGEMHDVRSEVLERSPKPRPGAGQSKVGVTR